MIDLKAFKAIADKVLGDMTVNDELKQKTMERLRRGKKPWFKTVFMPAACAAAVLIAVFAIGPYYLNKDRAHQADNTSGTGISTMAAGDDKATTPDSTFSNDVRVLKSWKVAKMEDVKKYMGGAALVPSYIPDGYKLKEITAAGPTTDEAISVIMEFESKGRSFTVYQSKGVTEKLNLERYKEVDVNGQKGYVNSNKFDGQEGAIYDTDLKWYKDDLMYMVQGALTEEEAIKVARSLK